MWNSEPILAVVAWWSLVLTAVFGGLAVISGLVGGVAATRASDIKGVADANKIAEANKRAAEANERAETARLQAANIANGLAWRELTPVQRDALKVALEGSSIEVCTSFVGNDPESRQYRDQIDEALRAAGAKTHFFSGWTQAAGVSILGNDTMERKALSEALNKADIPHALKPPHDGFGKKFPCLLIGTKLERL